jgi:YVTN family beta-propeller protein
MEEAEKSDHALILLRSRSTLCVTSDRTLIGAISRFNAANIQREKNMKRFLLLAFAVSALLRVPLATSQEILKTIPIGGQPGAMAVNTTTNMIYVPNQTLDSLTVISGATGDVVTNIPVGQSPFAAAVNPITNLVYVTVPTGPSVVVIDGSSNVVTTTIPATSPGQIAVNPATNMIYLQNGSGASLSVIDGSSNQITETLPTAKCCLITGIAVNTTTNRIYVSENGFAEDLVVVDGSTNKFATIPISGACDVRGVAVDSVLNRIYVQDDICGTLYVFSGATNKVVTTVVDGDGPMTLNSANELIASFNVYTLGFLNARTEGVVGNPLTFPSNQGAYQVVAGANNRYYVSFYKNNGIAVASGPSVPQTKY